MRRPFLAIVVLGLVLVAGPVPGQTTSEAAKPTELPAVALPPQLDRVLRDFERAWRANDSAGLASLFTEDGFVLQSNRPPARGRPAIQAAYEGQGGGQLQLSALAFAAGDTAGYIIGGYRYGDAPSDMGKFTLTLRRSRGKPWQIFSDMDNLNAQPKPRGAPETPASTTAPASQSQGGV